MMAFLRYCLNQPVGIAMAVRAGLVVGNVAVLFALALWLGLDGFGGLIVLWGLALVAATCAAAAAGDHAGGPAPGWMLALLSSQLAGLARQVREGATVLVDGLACAAAPARRPRTVTSGVLG